MFENIAGYQNIKEELLRIRSWILNREKYQSENVQLPKGVILCGRSGNGKTLFLKEYAKTFDFPAISIESEERDASKKIREAFQESKKNPFTIILIDEIDLLLSDRNAQRTMRSELDGVDSNPNVLVLATTNYIGAIDDALLRNGRFDRVLTIERPNRVMRKELFDFYIKKLGFTGNIDTEYLARTSVPQCSSIGAIVNDAFLRVGKDATTYDLDVSAQRIRGGDSSFLPSFDPSQANPKIAYHEVAHVLLAQKNKASLTFYRASFGRNCKSGYCEIFNSEDGGQDSNNDIANIEVSLAGYVMTKLKYHKLDEGCVSDLQSSRKSATHLVDKLGYLGPEYVLPYFDLGRRMETEKSKRKNEVAAKKIIQAATKRVKKYLKAHMSEADSLVSIMMKKGFIDAQDLAQITGEPNPLFDASTKKLSQNVGSSKLIQ